jgi:NADPH-dependent F420 reductase
VTCGRRQFSDEFEGTAKSPSRQRKGTSVSTQNDSLADDSVIGVLGGTGPQGLGLARRLSDAGTKVILGSRSAERAVAAATDLPGDVQGMDNEMCAKSSDVVIVAVPYEGHAELLSSLREALAGKVVIDCVNPMGFDKQGAYALRVPDGSACEEAQRLLPDSVVTGAFHHLSAVHLTDPSHEQIDCDVLVLGDSREATDLTIALAARIAGARGIFAGRLRNAHQVEAMTANLISVNRRYKAHAGFRVTDI